MPREKSPQMASAVETQSIIIPGPVGRLEALLERPRGQEPSAVAVVCHPHPQHGGTMQNKVAHTLARAFVNSGFAALRFNFRGVGASDGEFDEGKGEVDDVLAVGAYAAEAFANEPLWYAGFSFGAAMSVLASVLHTPAGLVSAAPAAFRVGKDLTGQPDCPWLIVHAENDELIPIDESLAWFNQLQPGPELNVFSGASHFFHGRLVELRATVEAFVAEHAAGTNPTGPT